MKDRQTNTNPLPKKTNKIINEVYFHYIKERKTFSADTGRKPWSFCTSSSIKNTF